MTNNTDIRNLVESLDRIKETNGTGIPDFPWDAVQVIDAYIDAMTEIEMQTNSDEEDARYEAREAFLDTFLSNI